MTCGCCYCMAVALMVSHLFMGCAGSDGRAVVWPEDV